MKKIAKPADRGNKDRYEDELREEKEISECYESTIVNKVIF
ncbi:MAG: hypothetical protein NTV58_11820 [Deltaproteobacteria bacterium]|nr:hypothetical protein [Deltaproteobacteria bacterium]